MRVLLIGGAGFIGAHLASELCGRGMHEVFVLEPENAAVDRLGDLPVQLFRGSLSDTHFLETLILDHAVEVVVHMASTLIPGSDFTAFQQDLSDVLVPSVRLMELCARHGVRLAFFSSGGTVYGNRKHNTLPFKESDALEPISYYGWSKQLLENCIHNAHRENGLQYLIFRPSNAYGPGQNLQGKQGIIAVALGKILQGETLTVWGDGNAVRDYLYIDDLIRVVCRILEDTTIVNTTLNIGSGTGHSVNEIIDMLREITGKELKVAYHESRKEDVSRIVLNIEALKERMDFSPIGVREGIGRFYHFLCHGK